jgi:prepilin peptidase CpaA
VFASSPDILLAVCLGLMIAASMHDLVARTIPNRLSLVLAFTALFAAIVAGHFIGSLLATIIVFLLAAFCWRHGWMGGGDVKLLGAATLCMPPMLVPGFIASVSLAGGVLALIYLVARRVVPPSRMRRPSGLVARALRVECWRVSRGGPLPYACAITVGAAFILLQGSPS